MYSFVTVLHFLLILESLHDLFGCLTVIFMTEDITGSLVFVTLVDACSE
jgi:hypothetical protein